MSLSETPHDGSFLLSIDDDGNLSRDNIVVASGAGVLLPGTVLGKITASGKYVQVDHTASDGSQNAAGILFGRVDATSADANAVMVSRHAEVRGSALIYKSGESSSAATHVATLRGLTVVAR